MSQLHPGLASALARLTARARRQELARALASTIAVLAASWALLALGDNRAIVGPGHGRGWAVLTAAAIVVAVLPRVRAWRRLGNVRLQAERLEGLRPELRGQLLAVVDRVRRPMGSAALVERMAVDVAPRVAAVPAAEAWPAGALTRDLALVAAASVALAAVATLPRDPIEVLARAFDAPAPSPVSNATSEAGPRARVGDITLRYLYPTYTRLDPVEVTNGSGEVRAPPGTQVEVRATATGPVGSVSLVVGAETLSAEVVAGRSLRGAFVVGTEGTWRWVLDGVPTVDFRVIPDPDLAPDVTLRLPVAGAEIPLSSHVVVEASVRDDFGVSVAVLEVGVGPRRREIELKRPLDAPRGLDLAVAMAPAELGLRAGDRATLRVGAYDNDAVSGQKVGWSAPVTITILGAAGEALKDAEDFRRFRDALVLVLAEFVVEPSPPLPGRARALPAWAAVADGRYADFDGLVDARLQGRAPSGLLATVLQGVGESRRRLVAFARGLPAEAGLSERDEAELVGLQGQHVRAVEESIYALDLRVRAAAAERVREHVEILAGEAEEIRRDRDRMPAGDIRDRVRFLSRRWSALQADARELGESALGDTVQGASPTVVALMEEILGALDRRAGAEAGALVQRLADQLADLAATVEELRARQEQEQQEQASAVADLVKRLQELEAQQAELRGGVAAARQGADAAGPDPSAAWRAVRKHAEAAQLLLRDGRRELAPLGADRGASGAWRDARESAEGLGTAADARALESALDRASRLERLTHAAELRARDRARRSEDPADAEDLLAAAKELRSARQQAAAALEQLERMALRAGNASPQLAQKLQSRAPAQARLAEEISGTASEAEGIARQLPVPTPGLEEGAGEARARSAGATEDLEDGRALDAEGNQAAAEEGLRKAREALQQAQSDMQELREGSRAKSGKENPAAGQRAPGTGGSEGLASGSQDVIPAPEEFASPEEYRKALLEGMRGQVPDAYKAASRRYYEELVRQ